MKKSVVALKAMILISGLSLVGCSAGTTSDETDSAVTTSSTTTASVSTPEVVSITPTDSSTGVLTNIVLSVTFSMDMDATTITNSSFTLTGATPVNGSIAYDATTRTATFTPDTALKPNTNYTASLTTSVTDSIGTALATVYQLQFTTETFIRRVSVDSNEFEATNSSFISNISADGRYVVFNSFADNLIASDTNNKGDIFIRDTKTGKTTRVSVSSAGDEGNGDSSEPVISGDGRYVVFQSDATNLVSSDTNGVADIFIHDTQINLTERISVSDTEAEANNASSAPSISSDGRYIAFASNASNLVIGDSNLKKDIFVRDRQSGDTFRVSVSDSEVQSDNSSSTPSISADGRYVAFESSASNLVLTDTNSQQDIFVRDTQLGNTIRVSLINNGGQSGGYSYLPSISSDGQYVAFTSLASDLVANDTNATADVFVRDTQAATTVRVSISNSGNQADAGSFEPRVSADGRYVAFQSEATNLLSSADSNGWTDVFVRDTQANTTIRVNVDKTGVVGTGSGFGATTTIGISANGRYVVFNSNAANLAPEGDANTNDDVFRVLNATP